MIKRPDIGAVMLIAALLWIHPAQARDTSGMFSAAYLLQLCKSDAKGKETVKGGHTACQSYISGIVDYHKLLRSLGTPPAIDFCVPNTEPMKKLQDIVWVYLAKNPQNSEFTAAPSVIFALSAYYPCDVKVPGKRYKR